MKRFKAAFTNQVCNDSLSGITLLPHIYPITSVSPLVYEYDSDNSALFLVSSFAPSLTSRLFWLAATFSLTFSTTPSFSYAQVSLDFYDSHHAMYLYSYAILNYNGQAVYSGPLVLPPFVYGILPLRSYFFKSPQYKNWADIFGFGFLVDYFAIEDENKNYLEGLVSSFSLTLWVGIQS